MVIENSPRIARVSWLFPGFALSVCRLLGLDVGGSSTDSASTENQQQSNEFSHSVNKTRKPTHFFHYITPITINNPFSKSHRATALLLRRISSSGYPKNPNEAEPLINDEAIGFVSSRRTEEEEDWMLHLHLLCKSTDSQSLVRPSALLHWELQLELLLNAHFSSSAVPWEMGQVSLCTRRRRILVLLVAVGWQADVTVDLRVQASQSA